VRGLVLSVRRDIVRGMQTPDDPRPVYRTAMDWVTALMRAVPPHRLDAPTPCAEFTVRTLMGHLIGTAERGLATGTGRPNAPIPHVVTDVPDSRLTARYDELASDVAQTWSARADLRELVDAPWGRVRGDDAVWGFALETAVHAWDLAVATGQPSEGSPALIEPLLARAPAIMPAEGRTRSYGDPVGASHPAGPTERLANWLGHRRA
jgi:uncharacterized protein (TIGR03086 family)